MTGAYPSCSCSEEIVSGLMALAAGTGIGTYDVYLLQYRSLAITAKNGRVDQVRRKEECAAAVRLIDHGRLGFAHTSVFTSEAMKQTVARAASGAKATDPQPELAMPGPPPAPLARSGLL